jgi:type II secretory pathway component PulJ
MDHRRACPAGGFTLVEMVISGALMSLILASAYACLQAAFSSQRLMEPRLEAAQTARVAMALMASDLRSACPLSREFEFIGMDRMKGDVEADNIDFATHNHVPRRSGEGDYCETSYFLDRSPESDELSLWRRRNPIIAMDPLSGGRREEIATGVRQLKFEYFDGLDWYDTWGDPDGRGRAQTSWRVQPNLTGMPEAVRITLGLDGEPATQRETQRDSDGESPGQPPMVFQTVVRLDLAGRSADGGSSESPSTPGSGGDNANQGQPVPGSF